MPVPECCLVECELLVPESSISTAPLKKNYCFLLYEDLRPLNHQEISRETIVRQLQLGMLLSYIFYYKKTFHFIV